jgi:hypothetical protein
MDGPASQQWQKKVDMVAMVSAQRTSLFTSSQPAMSLYLSSLTIIFFNGSADLIVGLIPLHSLNS